MAIIEEDYVGIGIDPRTGRRHAINHLSEMAEWEPGIYRFEENDAVVGGAQGVDNLPLQELTNRTVYLRAEMLKRGAVTKSLDLLKDNWIEQIDGETSRFKYIYEDADIGRTMQPQMILTPDSLQIASDAQLDPLLETQEGKLIIWANLQPQADIKAYLTLFAITDTITDGSEEDTKDTLTPEDIADIVDDVYPDD